MKNSILYIILIVFSLQKVASQNTEIEIKNTFNKAVVNHYANKDSAYFYYEKTLDLAHKNNDLNYVFKSFLYLINANGHYLDLANYKKNIEREEEFILEDNRVATFPELQFYKDYLLFDKGNYHYKLKQYVNSKGYFQELYDKIDAIPKTERTAIDLAMMSSLYSFLGLIYHHTNKYELASYSFKKDIAHLTKYRDSIAEWESGVNNSKKLLAQVYRATKNFNEANRISEEVLAFYKKKQDNLRFKNNILSSYLLISKNYSEQGKHALAIQKLDEVMGYKYKENPFANEFDLIYGDSYLGLKNYEKALANYSNSLDKALKKYNNNKHQDIATAYARLGKLYMAQRDIKKGLQYYQLALIQFEKEFNSKDLELNPNPLKVDDKTAFIKVLREKLEALNTSYSISKEVNYLKMAHNTSKIIISTLDVLRPEFESKLDKQFLINETYPSFQTAVSIAYKLYDTTKNPMYIDDAFHFIEKSKSISLLEAHRNAEATKYGNVPNEILVKGQELRASISYLEQQVFKASPDEIQSRLDTLSAVKNNYYNYIGKIEKNYATYYALKYNTDVASLNKTQQQLRNNQALLSYLNAEEHLFLIVIDNQKKEFLKLPFNDEIKTSIKNLYRKSSKLDINDRSIYDDSYTIYKSILEPGLLETNASDLIILPDDVLYYIPFDALHTSISNKPSFLIHTHALSYANSATLYQEQQAVKKERGNRLLVFAPSFNENQIVEAERAHMEPLLYNTKEAEHIAQYFTTKIFKNNEASISNLQHAVNAYNLLHFATHASANDEYPDYSYLAFSKDSSNSNLLYVKDIYNYTFNADMATLSACQTGFGKLQKGEGMLSLARAFNYAGVPAIVTTLWKINDQSTSDIMTNFYKNLSDGLNKKEALRQAKIKYLTANANDPLLQHPYYWSGIIISGNTLALTTTNYLLWAFIGVIGLTVILIWAKKLFKLF
ncbi:CHAT domain-containing protein [Oceanihabitans sp. IOP_32]|uniref:CHAT domain-containing protein n=1 Tax=Oceanihabitans sp. IOP_32 TaxID=2529032 RepID=UPI0018854BC5|nr:CHAT domain-containing tetratricopeptide repeat protein [Oceanihabitans sp. IOP_32]